MLNTPSSTNTDVLEVGQLMQLKSRFRVKKDFWKYMSQNSKCRLHLDLLSLNPYSLCRTILPAKVEILLSALPPASLP